MSYGDKIWHTSLTSIEDLSDKRISQDLQNLLIAGRCMEKKGFFVNSDVKFMGVKVKRKFCEF